MSYKFYISDASNHLLFATVRIEVDLDGDIGVGTGFFFSYGAPNEATRTKMLVTNKHVVEGAGSATIRFHRARYGSDTEGRFIERVDFPLSIRIPNFPTLFTDHPEPSIDLCAAPLAALEQFLPNNSIFYECVHSGWIMSNETLSRMRSAHPIQMVGYPYGLADEKNGFPLFRHGFTGLQPSIDFEGRQETVLDIATYAGSSGSPVFVLDREYFSSVPCFFAVLYAGPVIGRAGKVARRPIPLQLSADTGDQREALHFVTPSRARHC